MRAADFDPVRGVDSQPREILTPAQQVQKAMDAPVVPLIGMLALFFAAFGNLVNVALDKNNVALDGQVLVKLGVLAVCGIYGVYGFMTEPKVRRLIMALPLMWIVIIIGFFLLAVPGSVMPTESLAAAISITCVLLMTVTCLVQLGVKTTLNTVFWAGGAFVVLSWAVFFLVPVIGVFAEPLADGQFAVRMSGLAHPNTLGQFSGLLIVIGVVLKLRYQLISKWRVLLVLLAVGALIGSLSRTSLLATAFAIAVVYRRQILKPQYAVYLLWLALIGFVGLTFLAFSGEMGDIDQKLAFLSKSGDTEELFSATGRAGIWGYAISLISERPFTGYGATTSKFHLADYSLYTHNMILHVAFSCGVLGGMAAIFMCLGRVRALITNYHVVADGLVAYILINGVFENAIFSNLAGLPTIVWIIGLCVPSLEAINEEPPDRLPYQPSSSLTADLSRRSR